MARSLPAMAALLAGAARLRVARRTRLRRHDADGRGRGRAWEIQHWWVCRSASMAQAPQPALPLLLPRAHSTTARNAKSGRHRSARPCWPTIWWRSVSARKAAHSDGVQRSRTSEHVGHQPIAVALNRAAQRLQLGCHAPVCGGDIAERGQPRDLGCRIGYSRGGRFGGTEQRLFARRQNGIPRQIVDARQCRQRRARRLGGLRLTGAARVGRSEPANGGGPCDADSQQRDHRQRAVGDGFLGAQAA